LFFVETKEPVAEIYHEGEIRSAFKEIKTLIKRKFN